MLNLISDDSHHGSLALLILNYMNKKTIIFVLVTIELLMSCVLPLNQEWVGLDAVNTSKDSIFIYLARGHQWSPTVYPDTCLPKDTYVGNINLPHTNDSISGYLVPVAPHDTANVELSLIYCADWKNEALEKFFADYPKMTSWFFISFLILKGAESGVSNIVASLNRFDKFLK